MQPEPFTLTEDAVFWAIKALRARHGGANTPQKLVYRPRAPDDVIKALDRLYRCRRIDPIHLEVLGRCAERGYAPSAKDPRDAPERKLWDEAMRALGPVPARRKIVRPSLTPREKVA
jgi:hypothetical protein